MNITYVSTLCSKKTIKEIKDKYNVTPLQSIQKYHRLICEGLVENKFNVKTISSIPIPTDKTNNASDDMSGMMSPNTRYKQPTVNYE